jgi:hypothetical protein
MRETERTNEEKLEKVFTYRMRREKEFERQREYCKRKWKTAETLMEVCSVSRMFK